MYCSRYGILLGVILCVGGVTLGWTAEERPRVGGQVPRDATSVASVSAAILSKATPANATSSHANKTFNALQKYFDQDINPQNEEIQSETEESPAAGSSSFGQYFGKMLISLAFVILFALGLAWLAKRFVVKNRTLGGNYIDRLGSYALSQKSQIHLIRVGDEYYLIGEGGNTVSLISQVNLPQSAVDESIQSESGMENQQHVSPSFGEKLSQWQSALEGKNMQKEVQASLLLLGGLTQRLRKKAGENHE